MLIQSRLVVSEVSKSPYYYKGESVCRGCDEYGWLAVHTQKSVWLSPTTTTTTTTTTTIRLCDCCCCCCWVSRVWLSLHTRHGPCLRFILSGSFAAAENKSWVVRPVSCGRACCTLGLLVVVVVVRGSGWRWCVVVRGGGGGGTGCMGRSAVDRLFVCIIYILPRERTIPQ